jgi:hypothetical protein
MDYIGGFMQHTEKGLKEKNLSLEKPAGEKTRSLESGEKLKVQKIQEPSIQLSKDLAGSLMKLINDVNKDGVSPETVNASCNAAAQIYKILRLNFEMKKEGY